MPPVTPARRTAVAGGLETKGQQSTVKGKKIRISVAYDKQIEGDKQTGTLDSQYLQSSHLQPQSQSQYLQSSQSHIVVTQSSATPLNSKSKIILSSTTKKPPTSISVITDLFPTLKNETGILNWTMEELLERLVKEKVGQFEEFLREQHEQMEN